MFTRIALCFLAAMMIATASGAEDLSHLKWETNDDDLPIGDPQNATKGGTFRNYIQAYPLTFRILGPNANDAFAGWNRAFTMDFTLTRMHPQTDNFIPWMATHWSVQEDDQTVYYKLDPDARWSDGRPIVASDYVFTLTMMKSPHTIAPYFSQYAEDYYESVEAIDDHTLKIVGKFSSWRPMADFSLWPSPEHVTNLNPEWTREANNIPQVTIGPYTITEMQPGQHVVFSRIEDWWGEKKHYMQGLYNPDRIFLRVIHDTDRGFDFFKKRELDYYQVTTAKKWSTEMDFEATQKGWAYRKREFVDYPQGLYGLAMNLQKPIFQNKDFRQAMQYLFHFEEINEKLMYGAYYRMISAFTGTEYANPELKPYGFDPRKAREHLQAAGYTKRGKDGILVDGEGNRASFTLTYGQKGLERHFTVMRQIYGRMGVEINLQLLEPGAAFERGLERQYEACIMSRTTGLWPSPFQYYGSVFKESVNNNNIWYFGTAHTDSLIDVFRFDLDRERRVQAMHELDVILQDEAFYIPFWHGPFVRFLAWDNFRLPATYFPKRFEQLTDWHVYWIDEERLARLNDAIANGTDLGADPVVDIDPYGIKAQIEMALSKE